MVEETERRQNITREVCELKHKEVDSFMSDTRRSIDGVHKKLNGGLALIIANLASIVAALIVYIATKN